MENDTPVYRSSLVPVLGCIALILFGLNFYRLIDRELLSKWRLCGDHVVVHEHLHHPGADVMVFEVDRQLAARDRALQRNFERARQALERVQRTMNRRGLEADMERLHEELQVKQENMEQLRRELELRHEHRAGEYCEEFDQHDQHDRHRMQIQIIR